MPEGPASWRIVIPRCDPDEFGDDSSVEGPLGRPMRRIRSGPVRAENMADAGLPAALLGEMGCSKIDVTAMKDRTASRRPGPDREETMVRGSGIQMDRQPGVERA